ncbi:BEACH domain-containing protein B isoform X2 [Punica granatum]|uniref:BEACH domain-containing protein B isoform X2 n=1 Tax=Punica granatum TaxID=22663 RepID=A0A6P8DMU4_PUNGR|nr:BEACH domain-containing protein B isoform X2 [Punica granatum]
MNIVKGVADLIRRTSGTQTGESGLGSHSDRFSPPAPRICFSEVGDEAVLYTLWERYEKEIDKVEKKKSFHVFLKQFLSIYQNWEPVDLGELFEATPLNEQLEEHPTCAGDTVIGCSAGHPPEVILIFTQELGQINAMITELSTSILQSTNNFPEPPISSNITSEGLCLLEALSVITRSMHNCRTFGYYGGVQKLTAVLKGAVIQLKTVTGALSTDESLSNFTLDKIKILQRVLVHAVSIILNFIDLDAHIHRKDILGDITQFYFPKGSAMLVGSAVDVEASPSEARLQWQQKAVVSVMEAGGLNWLVELLRVIRRLSMKEQWSDMNLQHLTLRTLRAALSGNPRGQNHFKSIGGLEVLLDGLGLPSNNTLKLDSTSDFNENRDGNPLLFLFQLHTLSFEVLREATFGNLSNLQFLCENGRVHKFANSFCSPVFILQDHKGHAKLLSGQNKSQIPSSDLEDINRSQRDATESSVLLGSNLLYSQVWNAYVAKLSEVLCSFLFVLEAPKSHVQVAASRAAVPVSSAYCELSIKWILRVLLTVFPCIKACSDQNELPTHLRVFINTLQRSVLNTFQKVLTSSPAYLEVFRDEGIWDLLFSENFFYFGPAFDDSSGEWSTGDEEFSRRLGILYSSNSLDPTKATGAELLQMDLISFVELAATSKGSAHNLPELSVLLDALEQSACNPVLAIILARSLLRILQLSTEKTVASFKALDAIPRVLKVVCVQAQESRRSKSAVNWHRCMEISISLFTEFLSRADVGNKFILESFTSIDCLFELFWEEKLRNHVLKHVLDLMKIIPTSEDDRKAKLYLCSKYLETFTQIREREKSFAELSIVLLVGMRDMIRSNPLYFQDLFRDGECFLHVVSLLNGNLDTMMGEELVLNVLQTLTCLLANNDASKAAFRTLVGTGYRTLQSLLLDFCQWRPSEALLNALLDMLVDGKFDVKANHIIKNEDVIILYLSVLHKSSESLCHHGLNLFQILLRDSLSNQASCVRAGMLSFLLDWFSQEENDSIIMKIAQLIQVIGGHSISGKDIRRIFALLRSEKIGARQQYCSLLLTSVLSMLNEKGPTAFFDLSGIDSGIKIKTPIQWPLNKGFSFSCWLRVENFPRIGAMSLFSFLTDNNKGCMALLSKDWLIYESSNLKRQCAQLHVNLVRKKWHFLCITHSIGRAFSGGSLLRCYVDGNLVSSERCSYAKVNELLTQCSVGAKVSLPVYDEDGSAEFQESYAFHGQIGPVYMFNDAISSEIIQGIYSLGPSYMYSFVDQAASFSNNQLPSGIFDPKDGLASKIMFGLNAQASDGRTLLNASAMLDQALDKNSFEATVMIGTQLCSRRLLQEIIYCVGGVSVFFPLIAQSDRYESEESGQFEDLLTPITKERLTAEVIELIASVLDENLANQQQMHLLCGFSILGFLLQSVPPQQLNLETLSALKHLFNVITNCGLAEVLIEDAISHVFLNPLIWVYTAYRVQRELYMFLIQQFDNDPRLLTSLCRLPRVLDIIRQYYWDVKSRVSVGGRPLLNPVTKEVIGERPSQDEIRKIRLLLLGLGEMSLRQSIAAGDIKALVAFFETSQDMACVEDVLHMVIRAISQKPLLASFLDQVNLIGGCHIFVNLLQREYEPIRLLSLQFLGRLLVGIPSEKKGPRFFNLAVGRSKSLSESYRNMRTQPIFSAISDRLFKFPQTDNLCATLFDVLLGGASPKQVLQKHNQVEKHRSKGNNSQFFLPQILSLIFRFLAGCQDASTRIKILGDLSDLLDTTASNIEALMEHGWNAWLAAVVQLDVFKNYETKSLDEIEANEQFFMRSLFCVVLGYHILSVKGGWQQLEETVNFLLMHFEQDGIPHQYLLHDIFDDLVQRLLAFSSEENIFVLQPCRDNTLYLLKLVDEMIISELDNKLPFPASSSDFTLVSLDLESYKDFSSALQEVLREEANEQPSRNPQDLKQQPTNDEDFSDKWWNLYDNLWIVVSALNGKGPSKLPKSSLSPGPSFGQRARGLVESLNIPAAEMAAVVVSGGISNALGAKPSKSVDKAMLLRGERCPKIVFRFVILYLCKASLERASRCVQQFISLLPYLLVVDDEQSKTRLQLFIWALLAVRSRYGMLDDGARFHIISHLIRETVNCGKSILATSIAGRDDSSDSGSNSKESGTIHSLIQKDRVLTAVADEAKYMKFLRTDRNRQLHELRAKIDDASSTETNSIKAFEDEMQSILNTIVSSDDSRKFAYQLILEEQQQNVAEKWMHLFRILIDERGPWSANPFPNSAIRHWKLDKTEDRWRRRQKLRQNYHFDEKLCYPPRSVPQEEGTLAVTESKYGFVGHIPEQMKRFLLKGVHRITDEGSSELNDSESELTALKASSSEEPTDSQHSQREREMSDHKDIMQERMDSPSSPETEESERKLAGRLAVMKAALHFFGEFLVEGTGGSSVFKNLQASSNPDPSKSGPKQRSSKWNLQMEMESEKGPVPDNSEAVNENAHIHRKQLKILKRHRRWNIGKIKAVHWTRYLLRYTATEVFFSDSVAPVFFNFATQKDAKEIGTLIVATRNEFLFPKGSNKDKSGIISFVDRRVALEMAETARERWRRRDITNFEYLMILNTLSGRSYNDITQYPVFPWVLADYSSETLDFNKSSTFRDLSKPVGALDSKRFEVFEDRFCNFCDPDIPSFYYGSHYSSMGIVLYYLLRLEPFTGLHRHLQGGKFDHADRLFQSVEGTYRNCLSNTSDVKELIPEFFYMPEFLVNSNSYHLGVKQDGEPIGDVCLPPWAKGSPEEFVSKNREALESEYVSSNLHHWIDLVFGYKQRGKPAVEAANVFYYLTYEGAVDLDSMEDDLQRSAIEDQIANFGQTPIQIFRKKHPRRGPPIPIAHPLYFAPSSINLSSVVSIANYPPSAVLYVGIVDSNVVLVSQGLTLSVKMWLTTQLQSGGNFTFSSSQDPSFGIGSDVLSPRKIGSPLAGNSESGAQYFATMQTPTENFLISCGNWENSFQVISLNDGRMVQSIRQHKDVVSCVAVTSDGSILATGSYDTTVMVWEVIRARAPEKRVRNSQSDSHRKDYVVSETPFHILCGHDDIITCLFISVELDIVISGSKDGTCIFHTLREGRYVRSLRHPSGSPIGKLAASPHGRIVLYADEDLSLNLYSINGKRLASCESNGRLNCVELSSCGEFLVCGGDQGQVVVRSMNSLEIIQRYSGVGKVITSLVVTPEECFLAGTKDGNLLVYSIENAQLRRSSLPRSSKSKSLATG